MIALFPAGCIGISLAYDRVLGEETKLPVRDTISEYFPVLVVVPTPDEPKYTAEIVYYIDLEIYKTEHPDYQFLIPGGHEERIATLISERTQAATGNYDDDSLPYSAGVKIISSDDGKQTFRVSYRENDDTVNRGWYEASTKNIEPEFHENYFGPGKSFDSLPIGFFIMFALYTGIGIRQHLTSGRQKRAKAAETDGGAEEV